MSGGGSTRKALPFTRIGETADNQPIVAALRFAGPAGRDQALAAITTSGSGCGVTILRSIRVAAPIAAMAGRVRPVTRGFTNIVDPDPLFLALPLHPHLFDGARPSNAGKPGLIERQIRWQDKFHTDWQDATDVTRVFFLPDAFRLARRDSPVSYTPLMAVRMVAGATPEAEPQIAFEFVATPWIDTQRLDAAQKEFARTLPPAPKPAAPGWPTRRRLARALALAERIDRPVDASMRTEATELAARTDAPWPGWTAGRHETVGDATRLYVRLANERPARVARRMASRWRLDLRCPVRGNIDQI